MQAIQIEFSQTLAHRIFFFIFVTLNISYNLFEIDFILALPVLIINLLYLISLIFDVGQLVLTNEYDQGSDFSDKIIPGLCFVTLSIFILNFSGLPVRWIFLSIILPHVVYRSIKPQKKDWALLSLFSEIKKIPWPILLIVTVLFFSCLIPRAYHDALNYHLLGPWLWSKNSSLSTLEKYIPTFHCAYYEQLYLWGMLFFKDGFAGQIYGQIFGQLIHFFFGGFLSVILILKILKKLGINEFIFLFMALIFTFSRLSISQLLTVAKNDWIGISISLYLFLCFFDTTLKRKRFVPLLFGGMMGYIFILKYSYIFFLFLVILWAMFKKKLSIKDLLLLNISFVLVAFPYLARNYYLTQNPVFPLFPDFFPSQYLGPTWFQGFSKLTQSNISMLDWMEKFLERILAKNPLNILIFVSPFLLFFTPYKKWILIWMISFFSLVLLFIFSSITITETRHSGISIIFLQLCVLLVTVDVIRRLKSKSLKTFIQFAFIVLCFLPYRGAKDQHLVFDNNWSDVFELGYEKYVEKNMGHEILHFLHNSDKKIIFTLSDIPLYYFAPHGMIKAWDWSKLDKELVIANNAKEIVEIFLAKDGTHLFINDYFFDRFQNSKALKIVTAAVNKHPKSVVFHSKNAVLVDLKKLEVFLTSHE